MIKGGGVLGLFLLGGAALALAGMLGKRDAASSMPSPSPGGGTITGELVEIEFPTPAPYMPEPKWVYPRNIEPVLENNPQVVSYVNKDPVWGPVVASGGTPLPISEPGHIPQPFPVVGDPGLAGFYTPTGGGYASIYAHPSEFYGESNARDYAQYIGNPEARAYYMEELEKIYG